MGALSQILCPTDFSSCSRAALDYALSLGERYRSEVDLVHICNVPHYVRPDLMVWVESGGARPMSEIAREQAEAEMQALLQKLSAERRALLTTSIHVGSPSSSILRIAEDRKSSMIVMGTHGRTGFEHLILGSVAERVVRRAQCPVLVVRPPEAAEQNEPASSAEVATH